MILSLPLALAPVLALSLPASPQDRGANERPLVEIRPGIVRESADERAEEGRAPVRRLRKASPRGLDERVEDLAREVNRDGASERASERSTDRESRSHTRRVVVVNGETIVDEETVDGRPVRPGSGRGGGAGTNRAEEMLRQLEEDMRRELGRQRGADARATSERSSHTRRVVVRNGETIVDEETVDGRPVRPGSGRGGGAGTNRAEEMLRQLEEDMWRELGRQRGADARATSERSSHTRRVVVRNGETIVDEETVDGRPVQPGRGRPGARAGDRGEEMLQELLRELERENGKDEALRRMVRELERQGDRARDSARQRASSQRSGTGQNTGGRNRGQDRGDSGRTTDRSRQPGPARAEGGGRR